MWSPPDRVALVRSALRAAVIGLLSAYAVGLLLLVQQGRVLPNVSVAGVAVGGLEEASLRRILTATAASLPEPNLVVSGPGLDAVIPAGTVGLRIDVDATVASAMAQGRRAPLGGLVARILVPLTGRDLPFVVVLDEQALERRIDDLAVSIERDGSVGTVTIAPLGDEVHVSLPVGALRVDRDLLQRDLQEGFMRLRTARIALPLESGLPPSSSEDIESIAAQLREALATPLVLAHDGRTLRIPPDVLARIVRVDAASEEDADGAVMLRPRLDITRDRVERELGTLGRAAFDRTGQNAEVLTARDPGIRFDALSDARFVPVQAPVRLVGGESTTRFSADRTAAQLERMIGSGRSVARADLIERQPNFTRAEAADGLPTHLIGTFTTYYTAGAARNINIRRLADTIDDRLVAPGDEFSINATSGPRRCGEGYVPAGTIVRGELVDTCGGGVSQFGTTTYNAAFFAGLPITAWTPHSFFISRYPAGREATLSYPELDVRFINDTAGWIVIRSVGDENSVTVSLYGIPTHAAVRAAHSERRNPTDFQRIERPAADLAPGRRRLVQSGGGGFTITVTRSFEPIAGATPREPERAVTVYRPQARIVEVGITPTPTGPGTNGAG